jgi:hypothetical protein
MAFFPPPVTQRSLPSYPPHSPLRSEFWAQDNNGLEILPANKALLIVQEFKLHTSSVSRIYFLCFFPLCSFSLCLFPVLNRK